MPTLLEHLRATGLAGRAARDALATGKVRLRGVPTADPGREVAPADVRVEPRAPRLRVGRDPVLLWRDRRLAAVWKPPGLLSVPAAGRRREGSVLGFIARLCGAAHAVHRLDEDTSGVMLVALDEPAAEAVRRLFAAHAVERRYLALVAGAVPAGERRLDQPIVRDRGDGLRGVGAGGVRAVTFVTLVEPLAGASLVRARLETGRTHQVRVHLAAAGHPVLGDPLYAPRGAASRAPRLALHAEWLELTDPFTRRRLRFEAPLADDLERLRRKLARRAGR